MKQQDNAAKFAFFYMLVLVALVFTSLSTGMIIFQIINKNIVDVVRQNTGFSSHQLKFAISALLIAGPIFYLASRQIYKNLFSGALSHNSGVRKWLTYLVLFVSSVVMLGWLIATVNGFLDGELTVKFILKAVTAVGIAVVVFSFYYYDIRRDTSADRNDRVTRAYFYGSLALIIIVFTAGLSIMESPREARKRKLDNAVLDNFDKINMAVEQYYRDEGKLPASLAEIVSEFGYITEQNIADPETGEKFEYKIKGERKFALCADFRIPDKSEDDSRRFDLRRWPHGAGWQCLEQRISRGAGGGEESVGEQEDKKIRNEK